VVVTELVPRIWVRDADDALGYEVLDVEDPEGRVEIEPGVWAEYVHVDLLSGRVSLSDEEWERVLWWLGKPVPPGTGHDLDVAIMRKIARQRGGVHV
jgi:hypothetical protein